MSPLVALCLASVLASGRADVRIQYALDEELDPGYHVGNLKQDSGALANYSSQDVDRLRFGLLSVEYQSLFEVDEVTGIIYLKERLDRERLCVLTSSARQKCVLAMEAAIVQPTEYFTVLHLDITIRDINDNAPAFPQREYSLTLSETSAPGSRYMLPMATDPDVGDNSVQSYYLKGAHPTFSLLEGEGASGLSLVLESSLDRETQSEYSLEIVASDGGVPIRSGSMTIQIQVADVNDNSPVFDKDRYEVTIPEDFSLHTSIIQVKAVDLDEGQNGKILYSLSPQTMEHYANVFSIDNRTGVIFLSDNLDYQMGTSHQLIVIAQDSGLSSLQDHTTVTINVRDVNNHSPEITVHPVMSGQRIGVRENTPPGEIVALVTVKDLDPGMNGVCVCESLDQNFRLEQMYENGYKVISEKQFDRELQDSYHLMIRCRDSGTPTLLSEQTIELLIFDTNDNSPVFSQNVYTSDVGEDALLGASVIQISATDPDEGESARLVYSLDQQAADHLNIDHETGLVTLRAGFDYEVAELHEYSVLAQDHGMPAKVAQALLRIRVIDANDEPPVFIQNTYNFGTYENQANNTEIGTVTAVDRDSAPNNIFAYSLYGPEDILDVFSIDPTSGRILSRISLDREQQDVYQVVVVATDIEPPQLSSSVSVTIHVADKNDNTPVITVPDQLNNSVQVSVYAPLDFVFYRIIAHDLDFGKNARLQYTLANDYGAFFLDPMQGYILVKSDLHNLDEDVIDLDVIVSDEGRPRLSTSATLQVIINRTQEFARELSLIADKQNAGFGLDLSKHEQILTVLGAVTSLIVTFLVVAIVFVRRHQVSRHGKPAMDGPARIDYSQRVANVLVSQQVKIERDSSLKGIKPELEDNVANQKRSLVQEGHKDIIHQSCLVKKPLPELDGETASRHSGELSSADSGRGPSEEGDFLDVVRSSTWFADVDVGGHRHRRLAHVGPIAGDRSGRDKICPSRANKQTRTISRDLPLVDRLTTEQNTTATANSSATIGPTRRLNSAGSGNGQRGYMPDLLTRTGSALNNKRSTSNYCGTSDSKRYADSSRDTASSRKGASQISSRSYGSDGNSRTSSSLEMIRRTGPGHEQACWPVSTLWITPEASLIDRNDDLSSASSGSFIISGD